MVSGDGRRTGLGDGDQVGGRQADVETAPAARNVDRRVAGSGVVDIVGRARFWPIGLMPPTVGSARST